LYAKTRKQRTLLIALIFAFLLNNIVGMYANGALSPSKASSTATYYQYDHEYQDVVKKINETKNAVVLTNQGVCDLKMENEKMYSCSDLVLSNIDKQTVGSGFGSLDKLSSKFDLFSRLIYLNHSVVGVPPVDVKVFVKQGYQVLYSSSLYTLLSKQSQHPPCSSLDLPIACVFNDSKFIASANMSYAGYYWPTLKPKSFGDFVVLEGPPFKTSLARYWVLSWLYVLGLIACFLGLFLGRRNQFSGN
jgi:hypothetical protein